MQRKKIIPVYNSPDLLKYMTRLTEIPICNAGIPPQVSKKTLPMKYYHPHDVYLCPEAKTQSVGMSHSDHRAYLYIHLDDRYLIPLILPTSLPR